MYILKPDIEEESYAKEINRFEELVKQNGGEVETVDEWGLRTLAYEIDHYDKGYYVLMSFSQEASQVGKLKQRFKIDESVLRHQIVRVEE